MVYSYYNYCSKPTYDILYQSLLNVILAIQPYVPTGVEHHDNFKSIKGQASQS